jgi:DNA (cytosine-5)-methyltransferase 1
MARATRTPTLISLFSGAGGLDLGLESAGFETLAASELEENYCESLRGNQLLGRMTKGEFDAWFERQISSQRCYRTVTSEELAILKGRISTGVGRHDHLRKAQIISGDIRRVTSQYLMEVTSLKRGELTLLAGGPPCQPFSRAGKRETVETADGRLFKEFVRIVSDLRPEWFLFENVKGLAQSKTDVISLHCNACDFDFYASLDERDEWLAEKKIKFRCDKCGSRKIDSKLIKKSGGSLDMIMEEFNRTGYVCHSRILVAADFGVPQTRERLFIVGSRDGRPFEWPIETHCRVENARDQRDLFELADPKLPWVGMYDSLWANGHSKYGMVDRKKAVLWVKNVVRPHDEPVTWDLNRPSPTIGAHQAAKLAFAPKGIPPEQIFRQQWHTRGRRQGDTPPVFVEHEYLTDRELLMIQSFPAYWYLHGTRMERAFQIGNAVPPRLAEAVGKSILKAMRLSKMSEKAKDPRQPEASA